mgnify:CR=1 FL=1
MPACSLIETFCRTAGDGIEHQNSLALLPRGHLGGDHKSLRDAVSPGAPVHEHLGDIGAMRLILRLCSDDLHRAYNLARIILGDEQDSFL